MYQPPFKLTSEIVTHLTDIAWRLGRYEGLQSPRPQPQLRKQNRIRTIQGTLAIEGNTLTEDQMTAILEGRRVAGHQKEVLEVLNALKTYDSAQTLNPYTMKDLLRAHGMMMNGLMERAGKFRITNVGVLKGKQVTHVAPKAARVHELMVDLFAFLKGDKQTPLLVKACVFHYELEFIHPFTDGNGRMGRFWQHLISLKENRVFELVPVESLIKDRQADYYRVLRESDKRGDSTAFIEFSLMLLRQGLDEVLKSLRPIRQTDVDRIEVAAMFFAGKVFSRKDYINYFVSLSSATASRDLALGVKEGKFIRSGDKSETEYRVKI